MVAEVAENAAAQALRARLGGMSRRAKLRLYAKAIARQRYGEIAEEDDPLAPYANDPVGFITDLVDKQAGAASWQSWRTVLKAAYGQPLDEAETEFFRTVAGGRAPPKQRVRQLWLIVGRRAGKDSVASMLATQAATFADTSALRPGETALIACLATDRDQAAIVSGYIKGYFEKQPLLRRLLAAPLPKSREGGIVLKNNVEVRVTTNSYRAPRGRAVAMAIFDEIAFWRDENSATPDVETYRAILPGMMTIPNAMLVAISSPYAKKGLLYQRWRDFYGKDDDRVLVIQAPSIVFNPTLNTAEIAEDLEADPEAAAAEWLAQFRSDLADYVAREVVDECTSRGVAVREPLPGIIYEAFADPSGGARDSMTLAIGHKEGDKAVLDCLLERRAPFSPEDVVEEFAAVLKKYRVWYVTGDRYAGEWPKDAFLRHGVTYETCEQVKKDIYRDFLPMLNSRHVDLLDNTRMINQLCALERRTVRGGRDTIDHPQNGHDDLVNAAAGVCCKVMIEVSDWELLARSARNTQAAIAAAQEQARNQDLH